MKINKVIQAIRRQDNTIILDLAHDVDMSVSAQLREEMLGLLAEKPGVLIINLSEVNFMDSSGLATLIEAMQTTQKQKTELRIAAPNERVRSIFEIARLDSIFNIFPTEQDALD